MQQGFIHLCYHFGASKVTNWGTGIAQNLDCSCSCIKGILGDVILCFDDGIKWGKGIKYMRLNHCQLLVSGLGSCRDLWFQIIVQLGSPGCHHLRERISSSYLSAVGKFQPNGAGVLDEDLRLIRHGGNVGWRY